MADVMERARRRAFERAGVPFEEETPQEGEHRLIFCAPGTGAEILGKLNRSKSQPLATDSSSKRSIRG